MKYLVTILVAALMLLLPAVTASAQTFQTCADVDESGSLNIGDLARMMDFYLGGPALPTGRGDIDFRQSFSLGDLCYLTGYFFMGYPQGGCPPFSNYTMINTSDSVLLPEAFVPVGDGTILLPVIVSNIEPISNLLITSTLSATNCVATISNVTFTNWSVQPRNFSINGDELTLLWSCFQPQELLQPGSRTVAVLQIDYSASTGGTVSLNPAYLGDRFTHEVYGTFITGNYDVMSIGIPHIVVRAASAVPSISVAPDSMFFVILSGSGDPAPQNFDVISDGTIFDWSASAPSWINLTPSTGVSGATVTVQPLTAGLTPGTHVGTVAVSSGQVINSPQNVKVVLKIQPQFPSFDANCDGAFNVSDIVVLIMYVFGGPAPCDPCGLR